MSNHSLSKVVNFNKISTMKSRALNLKEDSWVIKYKCMSCQGWFKSPRHTIETLCDDCFERGKKKVVAEIARDNALKAEHEAFVQELKEKGIIKDE